jgi:hypothetical protein
MASAVFKIEVVRGGRDVAGRFARGSYRLEQAILAEFRELRGKIEDTFKQYAPSDRGEAGGIKQHLKAALEFQRGQPGIAVRVSARDPESGFDYLEVTRYGHRKMVIFPTSGRKSLAVHYAGHRNPHIVEFRPYVPGATPDSDWVEDAQPQADRQVADAALRLGTRIETRVVR